MLPARVPRAHKSAVRLLVVDGRELRDSSIGSLPEYLRSGDLLVVNDAATLPAALHGHDLNGNQLEVRLISRIDERAWRSVTFGTGDWQIPTEHRASPPGLKPGDMIVFENDLWATIVGTNTISERLVDLKFDAGGEKLLGQIYRYGKPVQYSYMNEALNLWSVQNIYSSRPWAVEMPSAGHAFDWRLLLRLSDSGIRIVPLTHGAGLSSTGDPEIDRALPLEERFEIPQSTMDAVLRARAAGGRVVAVGTSVVRALESANGEHLSGVTNLKIGPGYRLKNVDGILTGTHDVSESHYQLLRAFLPASLLAKISHHLEHQSYLTHEFGDLCLIHLHNRY